MSAPAHNPILLNALRWGAVFAAALAVLAGGVGLLAAGLPGLWGGLLGSGLAFLFLALTAGIALLLAAVNVAVRDTSQLLGIALQAWFYLTPIVYPQALMPERVRGWLLFNPAAALVGLYRQALIGGAAPEPAALAALVIAAGALLALGLFVFRRARPTFADEI